MPVMSVKAKARIAAMLNAAMFTTPSNDVWSRNQEKSCALRHKRDWGISSLSEWILGGRRSTLSLPCYRSYSMFSSSDTYRMKGPTCSISVRLATRSGESFTAGYGIGWKIRFTHPSEAKGAVPYPEG